MQDVEVPRQDIGRRIGAGLAALVAVAAVGYWVGGERTTVERVGDAYSTEAQIAVESDGSTYEVPLDVPWRDRDGAWQLDGTRPDCLPPSGDIGDVRFATVAVEAQGLEFVHVVAVYCN